MQLSDFESGYYLCWASACPHWGRPRHSCRTPEARRAAPKIREAPPDYAMLICASVEPLWRRGDDVTELRDRYFHTLGCDPHGASAKPRLEAALARAYQQRSFEIEHYWKRATYFWGFQIAIFAAFGLLWRASSTDQWTPVTVAIAALGFLTAVANSISARGSKFWQQNWEHHIDMLEDAIEGRLHKMVWLHDGKVSFSVSRVNFALSDCIVGFWLLASCGVRRVEVSGSAAVGLASV